MHHINNKMLSRQNQAIILWILLSLINNVKCSQQKLVNNAQSNNNSPSISLQKLPTQTNTSSLTSSPVGSDPSNGVDDILKDTILLLDVLDEKLNVVKNKTPSAMMRDNLRALDGANDDEDDSYHHHQQQQPQSGLISRRASQLELRKHQSAAPVLTGRRADQEQLVRRLDDEASMEEALVRMADGFASGRRNDHEAANELLIAAASTTHLNGAEQQLPKHHTDPNSDDVSSSLSPGPAIAEPDGQQASTLQGSMTAPSVTGGDNTNNNAFGVGGGGGGASNRGSKKARQLTMASAASAAEDNYLLASDSTERHIKFTLDLMQSIFTSQSYSAKTNLIESFLISPLSIQMVLMMMHLGARGQTRREISNCLHLTAATSTTLPSILQLSSSSSSQSQSNADKSSLMQIVGNVGAASVAGNDLSAAATAAAAVDPMGSKLKRRHQQQVSSENAKQQSSTVNNVGNSNIKSQQQSRHQQQQLPSAASNAPTAAAAASIGAASGGGGNNPHELFSGAMRNLLKDPIVMKSLTSANQIFLQKNLPLSAQYEWAIKHYYGADIKLVDFQHQSSYSNEQQQLRHSKIHGGNDGASNSTSSLMNNVTSLHEHHLQQQQQQQKLNGARGGEEQLNGNNNNIQQMVNDWIERQTKGKISNFLSSPISTSTLMMAINVLYFKGDWQYKFDPSDTETDAWFTQANGKSVKIPMMVNRLPLAFAHDPAMKTSVVELPYKAQRLGLFLLLPDEVSGIFHTMQMLNSTSFANLISSMRKPLPGADQGASGINVRIPKFSIESSPRLSQILSQQLGLKSLFMPDVADLSGMFGPLQQQSKRSANGNLSNPQQQHNNNNNNNGNENNNNNSNNNQQVPLQVGLDELLHKAVLQVDEQGSVAAASSATIVERVGLFNNNYFEADHPFLLFLMDKQTGLVLFSGAFAGNNNNHETQQQRH